GFMAAAFLPALVGESRAKILNQSTLGFAIACTALLCVTCVATVVVPRRKTDQAPRPRYARWFVAAAGASILLMLVLLGLTISLKSSLQHNWWAYSQWAFFHERTTALGSGVSVFLPVLLLGAVLYLWTLCQIKRIHLTTFKGRQLGQVFCDV